MQSSATTTESRLRPVDALLLVTLFWALVYLPGLGTIEIQGEEGRRLLPAVTMVETGDWIVPMVGGQVYQRKPPLINWMAAASFTVTGVINEWTARLPSALVTLALGLAVVGLTARWLGATGALLAAVFTLGNISMIEKGRLAEIEAVYMVSTGLAIVWWVTAWVRGASRWVTWLPAGLFLGLGMLAKGPVMLLFFYAAVLPTLFYGRRQGLSPGPMRTLVSLPHLLAFLLMLGVFALWALPNLRATAGEDTGAVWLQQFTERIGAREESGATGGFDVVHYLRQFPRAIINFLPWALLLPLLWRRGVAEAMSGRERALFHGLRWGMVASFFLILLPPGSSSRFVMPMLVIPALLLAMALARSPEAWPAWLPRVWRAVLLPLAAILAAAALACPWAGHWSLGAFLAAVVALATATGIWRLRARMATPLPLTLAVMALTVGVMAVYAGGVMPRLAPHDDVRPVVRELQPFLPPGEPLVALDAGFQPLFFYLRNPIVYVTRRSDVPPETRLLLVAEHKFDRAIPRDREVRGEPLLRVQEKGRRALLLVELEPVAPCAGGDGRAR